MLKIIIPLAILLLTASFGQEKTGRPPFDPNKMFSVKELQEDYNSLRKDIEKRQPNLYLYTSEARMDFVFDSLFFGINHPMNVSEFYFYISVLENFIKDGHNVIYAGERAGNYADKHLAFFPLHIITENGKLYSDMNCSGDSTVFDGAEILSINGKTSDVIQTEFKIRMIRDGNNETLPVWILNTYFRGFYTNFCGFPNEYEIEFVNRKGSREKTLMIAVPSDTISKYKKEKYNQRLSVLNDKTGLTLRFDTKINSAILTIPSFDPDFLKKEFHQHFKKAIAKFFDEIDSAKVKTVIIDLRDNGGGNPVFAVYLLKKIMNEKFIYAEKCLQTRRFNPNNKWSRLTKCKTPGFGNGEHVPDKNAFKGNIIVLMNGGSFSATGEFISVLQRYKRAVFIGEETGGNNVICGGQMFKHNFKLPNTGIVCATGTEATIMRDVKTNMGHGTLPDIFVQNSLSDILGNRDHEMEVALEQVVKFSNY